VSKLSTTSYYNRQLGLREISITWEPAHSKCYLEGHHLKEWQRQADQQTIFDMGFFHERFSWPM
jgi:hypothetical protein